MSTGPTHYSRGRFGRRNRLTPEAVQTLLGRAYIEEQRTRAHAESELAKQSKQFAAVIAAREEIAARHSEFDHALQMLVARVASITSANGAAIALLQGESVVCAASFGVAPPVGTPVDAATLFSGGCLRTGDVLCCEDTRNDERVDGPSCEPIRSIVVAPIRQQGKVIGIIEVYSCFVAAFGSTETQTVQSFAGFVTELARTDARESSGTLPGISLQVDVPATTAAVSEERFPAEPSPPVADRQELRSRAVVEVPRPDGRYWLFGPVISAILIGAVFLLLPDNHRQSSVSKPSSPTLSAPLVPASLTPADVASDVGSVQFHSHREVTALTIKLNASITFTAHRLDHPDRIYFDLPDTAISAKSSNVIEINDPRVNRIRIGKNLQGTTRVVIDLKQPCEYTAVISNRAPFRLVLDVGPSLSNAAPATSDPRRWPADATAKGANQPTPRAVSTPSGIRILIDPGHGGSDLGAVGQKGLKEKDLVLDIASRLGRLIRDRMGAQVVYTREADTFVPLQARSAMVNSSNADLFISIHGNSSDSRAVNGVETFYGEGAFTVAPRRASDGGDADENPLILASRKLASALQAELYKSLTTAGQGLRNRGIKSRALTVLDSSAVPSVLTEISFLTNPAQEKKLSDAHYRDQIAEALYRGVAKFVFSPAFRQTHLQAVGLLRDELSHGWR